MATTDVQQMHAWYMDDGRRSLASVARKFNEDEEELRTLFSAAGLPLKTAQPLRGAAAKNKAKAQASNGEPELHNEPVEAIERGSDEDLLGELTPAATVIGTMIEVLDSEIALLVNARVALAQVLGEGGEDE